MVLGLRMQFKNQAEARAAHSSELDALKSQLEEMETKLEESRSEAKAAKDNTKNVEEKLEALRGRFAETWAAKEDSERSLVSIRSELEAAVSAAAEERARQGSAVAALQATHTQELARLRDELVGNQQAQQRLEADLRQRSLALAEAAAARKAAEKALETHSGETGDVRQLKVEIETATRSKTAAETEARQLRAELEDKSMELARKEAEWTIEVKKKEDQLQDALGDAQQQKARADSAEPRAAEAEQRAEAARDAADALARKLDDAVTTLACERRALEEERTAVLTSQRDVRDARAEAEKQRTLALAADADCKSAKEAAAEECAEMGRKVDEANNDAAALRQQREALQQQLRTSYDESAQQTETIRKLEEELRKFRAEAAAMNPAQLLLLHDKGREVEQLKKDHESISNELERLQLGIAWDSTAESDKSALKDMVFTSDCRPVTPKGRPQSRGGRPRSTCGPPRPASARRSQHAAKRTPSHPCRDLCKVNVK